MQPSRVRAGAGRLRTPEQFAAVAGSRATWRAARQWVAASARVEWVLATPKSQASVPQSGDSVEYPDASLPFETQAGSFRVGFTVARRQARRAVQRVMVKRVLREAARHATGALCALGQDRRVDLVLRLRSPLPAKSDMSRSELKRSLRAEADSLLDQLARHLRAAAR